MGFFSELAQLGKEIGGAIKESATEIGGILQEAKEEIKDDPKKFAKESLIEAAKATGSVAKFIVNDVAPAMWDHATKQALEQTEKSLALKDLDDEQRDKLLANQERLLEMQINNLNRKKIKVSTELGSATIELQKIEQNEDQTPEDVKALKEKVDQLERLERDVSRELSETEEKVVKNRRPPD